MITSVIEQLASLEIGFVIYVSPDEIKAQLDIEAPDKTALNTGSPRSFPRINGYVLIPNDAGYIVGQVTWLTIENSPFPKRNGLQDFGLVDLPYPLRKMSLNPVGTLNYENCTYRFHRGVDSYPSVGDNVYLPTDEQLKSIVESGNNRRVKIGSSPLASDADVMVDPDRLFGRHLAILGNTGSGKSCSVAGLIRWSVEEAEEKIVDKENSNQHFIILDPNGEYSKAFRDEASVFKVESDSVNRTLQIPMWFWNVEEWSAFTQASSKAQRPTLTQALRSVKSGEMDIEVSEEIELRTYLRTLIDIMNLEKKSGDPFSGFPKSKNFTTQIDRWKSGLATNDMFSEELNNSINTIVYKISSLVTAREGSYVWTYEKTDIDELISLMKNAYQKLGGQETDFLPIDANVPIEFKGEELLRSIDSNAQILGTSDYIDTLLMRVKTLLGDTILKSVISQTSINLEDWLKQYIGGKGKTINVIDLSLLPTEIIHVVTAVIARMVFEALQRYRKINHISFPTVLVMEEAHTFVKRYSEDSENMNAETVCCKVFEKIAREGRKYGLGLVLSSQRPSELSPTVLSQCNTFLLHRISNDRDQELIYRLVPDNMKGLLRELPSLPSQKAILLGWASEIPIMVNIRTLPKEQQPESDDPKFWDAWTGKSELNTNWDDIAKDWQNIIS